MRLTGEKADLQKRFRVLLGNKSRSQQWVLAAKDINHTLSVLVRV